MNFDLNNNRANATGHKINLTPMVDIVFLLIIFFLVVSQFSAQERSLMDLPAAQNSFTPEIAAEKQSVILNIMPSGEITVDDKIYPQPELQKLLTNHINSKVIIRSDKKCTWSVLQPVFSACLQAGISTTDIAVVKE
ncbi:MAG: biopolymer transporter ExbD [Sedimentisphaerales bacterium]|nr:biopolymer transporter ExbD [Sedimentisphaerales bacterium]MBN2842749.1 biopolymer transporter ExbD [Sedimentisphaerales bacterium]